MTDAHPISTLIELQAYRPFHPTLHPGGDRFQTPDHCPVFPRSTRLLRHGRPGLSQSSRPLRLRLPVEADPACTRLVAGNRRRLALDVGLAAARLPGREAVLLVGVDLKE